MTIMRLFFNIKDYRYQLKYIYLLIISAITEESWGLFFLNIMKDHVMIKYIYMI